MKIIPVTQQSPLELVYGDGTQVCVVPANQMIYTACFATPQKG